MQIQQGLKLLITDIMRNENLSKYSAVIYAVSNMLLNMRKGDNYVLPGLNVACETTTIRIFPGMVRPTLGVAFMY